LFERSEQDDSIGGEVQDEKERYERREDIMNTTKKEDEGVTRGIKREKDTKTQAKKEG